MSREDYNELADKQLRERVLDGTQVMPRWMEHALEHENNNVLYYIYICEAIANRLEAIASRLEAIASRLEAITTSSKKLLVAA